MLRIQFLGLCEIAITPQDSHISIGAPNIRWIIISNWTRSKILFEKDWRLWFSLQKAAPQADWQRLEVRFIRFRRHDYSLIRFPAQYRHYLGPACQTWFNFERLLPPGRRPVPFSLSLTSFVIPIASAGLTRSRAPTLPPPPSPCLELAQVLEWNSTSRFRNQHPASLGTCRRRRLGAEAGDGGRIGSLLRGHLGASKVEPVLQMNYDEKRQWRELERVNYWFLHSRVLREGRGGEGRLFIHCSCKNKCGSKFTTRWKSEKQGKKRVSLFSGGDKKRNCAQGGVFFGESCASIRQAPVYFGKKRRTTPIFAKKSQGLHLITCEASAEGEENGERESFWPRCGYPEISSMTAHQILPCFIEISTQCFLMYSCKALLIDSNLHSIPFSTKSSVCVFSTTFKPLFVSFSNHAVLTLFAHFI